MARTPDWGAFRTVRLLQTSPSQHETFNLCKRKWWLKSIRHLPEIAKGSQVFGTVLHAVIERFLRADELGRDPATGLPVELFPQRWTIAANRWKPEEIDGECTPAEAEIIRRLVTEAIEGGVIQRHAGEVAIEQSITVPMDKLPCPDCGGKWPFHAGEACDVCGVAFGGEHDDVKHVGVANQLAEVGEIALAAKVINPPAWACPTCGGDGKGDTIQTKMVIDYLTPEGIQDHKTTKDARYCLSQAKLRENIQLLMNAKALLRLYEQDHAAKVAAGELTGPCMYPNRLSLRHNQFCKDPDNLFVRKSEAFVIPADVEAAWVVRVVEAREMSRIRHTAESWQHIPSPASRSHACNAYSGCPFIPICGGKETEEMYEKRIDKQIEMIRLSGQEPKIVTDVSDLNTGTTVSEITERTQMGIMDSLKRNVQLNTGNVQATAGVINPPTPQPVTPPAPVPVTATAPVVHVPAAGGIDPDIIAAIDCTEGALVPWADPTDKSCAGFGFNSKGRPCRICDQRASQPGSRRLTSDHFKITPMDDGEVAWQLKPDTSTEGISPTHATITVEVQEKVEAPAPVVVAPVVPVVTAPLALSGLSATLPADAPVTPVDTSPKAKRGRPAKGFILAIDCAVTKGEERLGSGRGVIHLEEVFAEVADLLVAAFIKAGKPAGTTYFDLDAFKRRDEMVKNIVEICEKFGSDIVTVDLANATPDMKAFVAAVRGAMPDHTEIVSVR